MNMFQRFLQRAQRTQKGQPETELLLSERAIATGILHVKHAKAFVGVYADAQDTVTYMGHWESNGNRMTPVRKLNTFSAVIYDQYIHVLWSSWLTLAPVINGIADISKKGNHPTFTLPPFSFSRQLARPMYKCMKYNKELPMRPYMAILQPWPSTKDDLLAIQVHEGLTADKWLLP